MKITLDMDALTFGDMEDFETATGSKLLEAVNQMATGALAAKELIALVWICQRSVDPDFTLDQARRLRLNDIDFEAPEPDPTPGSG